MTARENIIAYVVSILSVTNAVPAIVFRSREAAVNRDEGSALIVQPVNEPVETRTRGMDLTVRELTIKLTVLARSSKTLTADQAADLVIEPAHKILMQDITLGARAAGVFEHSTEWTFETADQTAVAMEVLYSVKYQTRASDLSALT